MFRTYSGLMRLETHEERFDYLRLDALVGDSTFGFDRYLNQMLYRSERWLDTRDKIIIRDNGCDLGVEGHEIHDVILVHHLNPLTPEQIENQDPCVFDPENLISTRLNTHNAVHYGNKETLNQLPAERRPNDTTPWLE